MNRVRELQKKVKEFKTREQAIYDMLALYEVLSLNSKLTFSTKSLLNKVINNIEVLKEKIPYKFSSFKELVTSYLADWDKMIEKYSNYPECLPYLTIYTYYSYDRSILDEIENHPDVNDSFNLISLLAKNNISLLEDVFDSSIPDDIKLEMFKDLIFKEQRIKLMAFEMNTRDKNVPEFREFLANIPVEEKVFIFEKLLKNGDSYGIDAIARSMIDFNEIMNELRTNKDAKMPLTCASLAAVRCSDFDAVMTLYNKPSYQKIDSTIKNYSDLIIIESLEYNNNNILNLINSPNFAINPDTLESLVRMINREQVKLKKDLRLPCLNFARYIMEKAKAGEEKLYKEYTKVFLECTDFEMAKTGSLDDINLRFREVKKEFDNKRTKNLAKRK